MNTSEPEPEPEPEPDRAPTAHDEAYYAEQPVWAVVGASNARHKYGNRIYRTLREGAEDAAAAAWATAHGMDVIHACILVAHNRRGPGAIPPAAIPPAVPPPAAP